MIDGRRIVEDSLTLFSMLDQVASALRRFQDREGRES